MTRRTTPAFATGGVSYLDHMGETTTISQPTPTGWRCFHCNDHFWNWRDAARHFGYPGEQPRPTCVEGTATNAT